MSAKASIFSSGTARPCRLTDPNFGGRQTTYFRAPVQLNSAPASSPISLIALENPPAPQSVMARNKHPAPWSRAQAKRRGTFSQQLDFQFAPHDRTHRRGYPTIRRRECCAVNAISAGAAANRNDGRPAWDHHAQKHEASLQPRRRTQAGSRRADHRTTPPRSPGYPYGCRSHAPRRPPVARYLRRQAAGRYVCQIRVGHAEDIGGGMAFRRSLRPRMQPLIPVAALPYGSIAWGGCTPTLKHTRDRHQSHHASRVVDKHRKQPIGTLTDHAASGGHEVGKQIFDGV